MHGCGIFMYFLGVQEIRGLVEKNEKKRFGLIEFDDDHILESAKHRRTGKGQVCQVSRTQELYIRAHQGHSINFVQACPECYACYVDKGFVGSRKHSIIQKQNQIETAISCAVWFPPHDLWQI